MKEQPATSHSIHTRITEPYLILLQLFSIALLMHFSFATQFLYIHFALLFLLNLAIWFRPDDRWLPLIAVLIGLSYTIQKFPVLANHSTIELFVSLAIVFLLLRMWFNKNPFLEPDQWSSIFRYAVFIVYFLTGFHKLNYGFLDPDTSCVNDVNNNLLTFLFGSGFHLPVLLIRFLQVSTLFMELILPFGILFSSTRKFAVLVLLFFHLYLCICWFSNFSALGLFLLAGIWMDLQEQTVRARLKQALRTYLFFALTAALIAFMFNHVLGTKNESFKVTVHSFIAGIIFASGFLYFSIQLIRTAAFSSAANRVHWKTIVPAFLLLFWGVQCYLGLSNRANLTMFSNLVTDTARCNHLIIKTSKTKWVFFEEDYVLIKSVSKNLIPVFGEHYILYSFPFIEVQNRMQRWAHLIKGPVRLELIYKGQYYLITDLMKNDFPRTPWHYRFLYYRECLLKNPGNCMW